MDQMENTDNIEEEYPVLRLANPIRYPNDNDNNMYYENYNDNTTYDTTVHNPPTKTTSNVTNLTGTVTNLHPLMQTSPVSPVSPDFPDLIPEKKHSKHTGHKNHSTYGKIHNPITTKFTFQPDAHSTCINLKNSADVSDFKINSLPTASSSNQRRVIKTESFSSNSSDTENENSSYEATLSPNLQNVSLTMIEKPKDLESPIYRRRRISLAPMNDEDDSDDASSVDSVESTKLNSRIIRELLESSEEIESQTNRLNISSKRNTASEHETEFNQEIEANEPIEEYSAIEERRDSRHWQKIVLPTGERRSIDMRVIEPYKRVLSHGGYMKAGGHNAIVVFSTCFLPDKRVDYDYVMDNLFLYVLATLDQLVTEDYVLVYLHGGAGRGSHPSFSWIKKCYQLVDRKLRKNLKQLYIVHPTIWVRTLLFLSKPFLSSKFYKKINYVHTLADLADLLPIEPASIPEKVKNYEKAKLSC